MHCLNFNVNTKAIQQRKIDSIRRKQLIDASSFAPSSSDYVRISVVFVVVVVDVVVGVVVVVVGACCGCCCCC